MIRRIRLVAVVALVALLAGSSLAWAATDDADDSDEPATLFTFGYDVANHLLVTGIHTVETVDCTLEGSFDVGYGSAVDDAIPIESLDGEDGPVEFGPAPGAMDADPIPYVDDANPCTLEAIVVAGPNGQVNHGQVVSAFSQALDIAGKGCVMRWIAKSGFGKADQQVQTHEVDPVFAPTDSGMIDLMTVMTACKTDGDDDEGSVADIDDGDTTAATDAKPDKVKKDKPGKPESPGNSANAPGHNKDG